MTLNAGLDIVIGLVLMYLTLSLECTVLNEMIASLLRLRATTLAAGIAGLIDAPQLKAAFDDHGLIDAAKAGRTILVRRTLEAREPSQCGDQAEAYG